MHVSKSLGLIQTQVEVALAAADDDLNVAVEILMSQQVETCTNQSSIFWVWLMLTKKSFNLVACRANTIPNSKVLHWRLSKRSSVSFHVLLAFRNCIARPFSLRKFFNQTIKPVFRFGIYMKETWISSALVWLTICFESLWLQLQWKGMCTWRFFIFVHTNWIK